MIGSTISHYKILEKLGEGGMGVVYRAEDLKLKRIVALKFLPQHLLTHGPEQARFLQEAQAASALNHPNVCHINAIIEADNPAYIPQGGTMAGKQQFIDMEYVDGVTLRQKIDESRATSLVALPVKDTLAYAVQIGEALQEAHSHGIVHRDIKCENIMVNSKNQIKVMDFGLAKLKGSLKLTRTSSTVGTLAYMAPEQIQGEAVDARSDIFSFGVVLYEMLTGDLPFRGEHEAAMMYSMLNEDPQPIENYKPELPSILINLIQRALEKDPNDRYQSVHEMVIELRRVQKQSTKVSRKSLAEMPVRMKAPEGPTLDSVQQPSGGSPSKKKLWIGIGGAVVLCAIAVAYLLLPKRSLQTSLPPALNPNMKTRIMQLPFTQIQYAGISPDGNWIVIPAADINGKWDIYFMNSSGGEARRITQDSSLSTGSAYISPDGSLITYVRFNPKTLKSEVCVVPSVGGASRKIGEGAETHWRLDGKRIGYQMGSVIGIPSNSGKLEFWSIKPDGSDNKLEFVDTASTGYAFSFWWSPDGNSIVWQRSFPGIYQELFTHDLTTGTEHQLTFDKANIDEVCWTRQDEIIFSSTKSGNFNLWMVPASGGQEVQITNGSGPDRGIDITADGKRLLYLQTQDLGYLWLANVDGKNAHQVTFDDNPITRAVLSSDGQHIVCTISDPNSAKGAQALYIMDRNGANRTELVASNSTPFNPEISPDGKWISYLSRQSNEPADSIRAYLIDLANPGTRKLLGKGIYVHWLNDTSFVLYTGTKSLIMFVDGAEPKQFFQDSTYAWPILNGKYILYGDLHKDRGGRWIIAAEASKGTASGNPKKLLSPDEFREIAIDPDGRFIFVMNGAGEAWRISLPDGTRERIPASFPGMDVDSPKRIGHRGKEVVWIESRTRSKLVMIENLHE